MSESRMTARRRDRPVTSREMGRPGRPDAPISSVISLARAMTASAR